MSADILFGLFSLATDVSAEPVQAAMALIILQLRGHASYGKRHCVSSLCGVVRQAGSWGFHCELFMVSLNGALMKNGDHFRPHCSSEILPLGATFI